MLLPKPLQLLFDLDAPRSGQRVDAPPGNAPVQDRQKILAGEPLLHQDLGQAPLGGQAALLVRDHALADADEIGQARLEGRRLALGLVDLDQGLVAARLDLGEALEIQAHELPTLVLDVLLAELLEAVHRLNQILLLHPVDLLIDELLGCRGLLLDLVLVVLAERLHERVYGSRRPGRVRVDAPDVDKRLVGFFVDHDGAVQGFLRRPGEPARRQLADFGLRVVRSRTR